MPKNQYPPAPKPWLKLWSHPWLTGSLRFDMTDAERGTWADLLALANECRNRGCTPGVIQANPSTPFPHGYIAGLFNTSLPVLEERLKKFASPAHGRIVENGDGIHIINFEYYNSTPVEGRKPGRPAKLTRRDVNQTAGQFLECNVCHKQVQNMPTMTPPFLSLIGKECHYCKTKHKGTLVLRGVLGEEE